MTTIETTPVGRFEVAWGLAEPIGLLNALVGGVDGLPTSLRLADPLWRFFSSHDLR